MTDPEPFRLFLAREGIDVSRPDATAADIRNAGALLVERLYVPEARAHNIVAGLARSATPAGGGV